MSILTHLMKYARKDTIGSNCLMFFPGPPEDASGTTITDIVAGSVITDAGTAWNVSSAATMGAGNHDSGKTGNIITPPGNDVNAAYLAVHVFGVQTSDSFGIFSFIDTGGSTKSFTVSGGGGASVNDDTGSETAALIGLSASSGNALHAGAYIPASGTVTSYGGVNAGTVTLKNTAVANAARIADGFDFSSSALEFAINTINFDQDTYGIAVFRFANGLPDDLLTGLAQFLKEWPLGRKTLYAPWKDLG